jgi:hypothetical protein
MYWKYISPFMEKGQKIPYLDVYKTRARNTELPEKPNKYLMIQTYHPTLKAKDIS